MGPMRERRLVLALVLVAASARAEDATPGYPERVLHWTTKNKETCADIANALYGAAKHKPLLERYNSLSCQTDKPLPDGLTLVVPAKVTDLPSARLRSLNPDVKARPPGGSWQPAAPGMPLYKNHSVNTLEKARADILFIDRTRVLLAEHTLVIIYGTAKKTAVAKTLPTVELDSGELSAGLAALRGKPVEVATKGGRVTAKSRDTAVRAQQKRATVSVFDGSASVASANKKVEVPAQHGTAFSENKPPEPPRPLPPAPKWLTTTSAGVQLGAPGANVLSAGWEPVDKARLYRVELAKDAAFTELVAREEVPASVRAFRAERLPPGAYFLRVRVIDQDDFLGLGAEARSVALIDARVEGAAGAIAPGVIEVSPYAELVVSTLEGLEVSLDGSTFGKLPPRIDLLHSAPRSLALRRRGDAQVSSYELRYREPMVRARASWASDALDVRVELSSIEGVDVAGRMAPFVRFEQAGKWRREPLRAEGGAWLARFDGVASAPDRVQVVDARGRVLVDTTPTTPPASAPPPATVRARTLGPSAALVQPSPLTNVVWWAPSVESGAAVSATAYSEGGKLGSLLATRAAGAIGSFGFDGLVTSRELEGAPADGSAWFTLRWRPITTRRVELGPAVQLGLPMTTLSPGSRVGLGVAAGGFADRLHWLVNLGGRAPLEYSVERRPAPDAQGFLLGGVGWDADHLWRATALLDAHAFSDAHDDLAARGGLTLGAELGQQMFAGVALRLSPWSDAGGHVMGQLALGLRARP